MRNFKKILSLVLCMAMMLSVMVVGAGAAFKDQSKIKNTEAVDMCSALNIINGYTDGSFKPEGTITRAEACKMICVALNGGKEPALGTNAKASFTDTKGHWAEGYIESCVAQGIVAGIGGGKFNPNGNVTGTQFAKMLLIALGYKADIQGYTGAPWEVNVNVDASAKGLYTDLAGMDPSKALSRDNAAQMVWNALQAKEVEYDYTLVSENGQLTSKITLTDKDKTLMQDKYGVVDYEYGQMTRFEYNSDKNEWTYYFDGTLGESHRDGYTTTADFTNLYGQTVKVIYDMKANKDVKTVYGMFGKDAVVIAEGVVGDISTLKNTDSKVKISGTEYKLEKQGTTEGVDTYDVPVYDFSYDTDFASAQQSTTSSTTTTKHGVVNLADDQAQSGFKFVAVDDNGNGKIDFFMVYPFSVAKVSYAGSKNFTLENQAGVTKTLKFEDVVSYKGLAEDDYVVYTAAKNTATNDDTIVKAEKVINGNVTATRGDYKFAVDGTWYEAIMSTGKSGLNLASGGTVKNVVVVNGYVFMADGSGVKSVTDYAVVIKTDPGAYANTAKLLFSDGTKKVVDTKMHYESLEGKLVTYETNSDNEYILTEAKTATNGYEAVGSGFDVYWGNVKPELKSDKVKYIEGADIADDAVIFLRETGADNYKVITGARLKTTNGTNMTVVAAYADKTSSTGYNTVKMAYVTNTDAISSADSLYGYLLSDAASVQNKDKKDVYEVTFLGEDGKEITLKTDDQDKSFEALKEGVVFSYTLNADGDIDGVTILGKTGTKSVNTANKTDAIIAYSGNYITLASDPTTRYEITKDTVILVIDAAGPAAAEGSVTKAYKDVAGNWVNNVIVDLDTTDKEVDLLVIDYQNDIDNVD